jgi:hypothetical protein
MVRHKGARSKSQVDRDFPHQVEIDIPEGGLGKRLGAMDAYCRARGFDHATRGVGHVLADRQRDGVRWCFTDPAHAEAFQKEFGGARVSARQ